MRLAPRISPLFALALALSPLGCGDDSSPPLGDGGAVECFANSDCDDGNRCTSDLCSTAGRCDNRDTGICDCRAAADCVGTITPAPCQRVDCVDGSCRAVADSAQEGRTCDDASLCTLGDVCRLGICTGAMNVTCADPDSCHTAGACDRTTGTCNYPNRLDGTVCDADMDGCSVGDTCRAGVCTPGPDAICTGPACTTSACVSTGSDTYMCESTPTMGNCLIGGTCYDPGTLNAGNPCQICDPARSASAWSPNAGVSCGASCSMMCQADGMCSGSPTADAYEANDTMATAANLGMIDSDEDFPYASFVANLVPGGDEDWYRYHDHDAFFGDIQPRVELRNLPAGVNYDLCVYFQCDDPRPIRSVNCNIGEASTYMGLSGCCSTLAASADETVRLSPDCEPIDDSGMVFVRVTRAGTSTAPCTYTVRWGDD